MIITLKFGDENTVPMNGDCAVVNFKIHVINTLKERGVIVTESDTESLDFCDMNGVLRGARFISGMTNISRIFSHRECYVPVIIETLPDDETIMNFRILWTCMDPLTGSMSSNKLHDLLSKNLNQAQTKKARSPSKTMRGSVNQERDSSNMSIDRSPGSRAGSRNKRHSVMYTGSNSSSNTIKNTLKAMKQKNEK